MANRTNPGVVIVVVGGVLAAAGLLAGLIPTASYCGSIFNPENPLNFFDNMACDDNYNSRFAWMIGLFVVAGLTLLVGVIQLAQTQDSPTIAISTEGIAGQLAELSRLRNSGALTEEQFEAAKQKLLNHP